MTRLANLAKRAVMTVASRTRPAPQAARGRTGVSGRPNRAAAPGDLGVDGHPPTRMERLARGVSIVANPGYIALPTLLLVALRTAPTAGLGLLWWTVTVAGISIAPLAHVAQGVRAGRYSDRHLSVREQRLVPLLVGLVGAAAALAALLLLDASCTLLAAVASVIVGGALAVAITHMLRWKISLHTGGAAGAVTLLVLLLGPLALLLVPLVVLVAWARWRVRAHTLAQAITACGLAIGITLVTFRLFGLR